MAEVKEIYSVENSEQESFMQQHAEEIDTVKESNLMRQIVSELKKTIKSKGLTALSAPAIGYSKRIFCVDFKDSEIKTFINPILIKVSGLGLSRENCSSIPNRSFIRPRNTDITIMYQRPLGQVETRQVVGKAAYVLQHELDHLDGLLLTDISLEVNDDFDCATDEEREEIIKMYLDSLDISKKNIDENIQDDDEAKQLADGIRFMEGVARGEITVENNSSE